VRMGLSFGLDVSEYDEEFARYQKVERQGNNR